MQLKIYPEVLYMLKANFWKFQRIFFTLRLLEEMHLLKKGKVFHESKKFNALLDRIAGIF